MKNLQRSVLTTLLLFVFLFTSVYASAQIKVYRTHAFDKVIISPHIEVIFKEGNEETVAVNSMIEPIEKLNVEVKNKTLRIYLDDAKIITEQKKNTDEPYNKTTPVYKGTIVKAVVTYKNISSLSLRGEEKFIFDSHVKSDKMSLKIYGETQVYIKAVTIGKMQTSVYGESYLEIEEGEIANQKLVSYGESVINMLNIESEETKIVAYGSGSIRCNASGKLKITTLGEAVIQYAGSPKLNKGIVIGEAKIVQKD